MILFCFWLLSSTSWSLVPVIVVVDVFTCYDDNNSRVIIITRAILYINRCYFILDLVLDNSIERRKCKEIVKNVRWLTCVCQAILNLTTKPGFIFKKYNTKARLGDENTKVMSFRVRPIERSNMN